MSWADSPSTPVQHWLRHYWWVVAFVPVLVYSRLLFFEFGYRDDYSVLREAVEQPGKLLAICVAEGRPMYGLLLQGSFAGLDGVASLWIPRMLGALFIGLVGALLTRVLITRLQWTPAVAFVVGALATVLPSAQVVASWAICWPQALAGVLAVSAFGVAELGLSSGAPRSRRPLVAALALLVLATLTYQTNALLYGVPLAAAWLDGRRSWRWLVSHLGLIALALGCSVVLTVLLFRAFGFAPANRVAIDLDPLAKLAWFAQYPLREALSLYVLRDMFGRTEPWYSAMQVLTGAAIVAALLRRAPPRRTVSRAIGWTLILLVTYAISFVARERWPTYRTIWPLAGVVLITACYGIRRCLELLSTSRPIVRFALAAGALAAAASGAAWNVDHLIARPQADQWLRIRQVASTIDAERDEALFMVLPRPTDIVTPVRHLDEFGSHSADADWAAKEMLKQALRREHPEEATPTAQLRWQTGYAPPPRVIAHVVDLRLTGQVR